MLVSGKLRRELARLIIVLLAFGSCTARADFKLTHLEALVEGGLVQVDAAAVLALSEDALKALESGVDLRVRFLIELIRDRQWIWDEPIKDWQMLFTLHFHQLSGQYILAVPQTNNTQAFNTIDDALADLSSRLSFNLGYEQSLLERGAYYLRAKIKLDTENLPAPLKLFSLFLNEWKLDSGWKQWALKL